MVILYLFTGIFAATLSALPLGASNIAVINTTLKENTTQAFKIAITAGIAEVFLSYLALDCNQAIKVFFETNLWIQTSILILLFVAGGYLFFKKQSKVKPKNSKITQSKYVTGFLVGIINPPVLIYWVIAIGVLHNNNFLLSLQSPFAVLFLFFFGVYLGKLFTLYGYSKFSIIIKNKISDITIIIDKVTGILIMAIAFMQSVNLYLF